MNLKVLNEFLTCCGSIWLAGESIPLGWPCAGWSSPRVNAWRQALQHTHDRQDKRTRLEVVGVLHALHG